MIKKGDTFSGKLGNYTIENEIGHGGGMGLVYLAKDQRQNPVVLKFPKVGGNNDFDRRLKLEAQILKELTASNNPYTVKYVDEARSLNLDDFFLVIESIPGADIEAKLGRDKMPENEVIEISIKIAKALKGLHQRNKIHRDVKPKNIMIKSDGNPILIDFGAAKMLKTGLSQKTVGHTLIGTHEWTCLHQLDPNFTPTAACDLYALGRTIFYMATGVEPWTIPVMSNSKLNPNTSLPFFSKQQKHLLRQSCSQVFTNLVEKLFDPEHQTYRTAYHLIQDLQQPTPTQSGPNHLGTSFSLPPSKQNPYIELKGRTITLDEKLDDGLLIGGRHDEYECVKNLSQQLLYCNEPYRGKNFFLGHLNCQSGCTCSTNFKHFIHPHHIRIWYDKKHKHWKVRNNVEKISPSAKKSPTSDYKIMKPNTHYPLNHNDEIAIIYVSNHDDIPITFTFYDP